MRAYESPYERLFEVEFVGVGQGHVIGVAVYLFDRAGLAGHFLIVVNDFAGQPADVYRWRITAVISKDESHLKLVQID